MSTGTGTSTAGGGRRWRPGGLAVRAVRRFRRRSRATQLRTVATVAAVVAGVLIYVAAAPPSGTGPASASTGGNGAAALSSASTSTRGISGNQINVVFPVVSLTSLVGRLGIANDAEYAEQKKAIKFYVGQVNKQGGIHGKKIHAIIATFTPENTSQMRSLCKNWTEGSPAAFAVVDGEGTWSETNQLCVTQEGHTPLLSQWTTVRTWTKKGSPYLWWIGPSQTVILQATVNWGLATGMLGGTHKVGVIAGNRASDQLALKKYLLPDLRRAGVQPVVETIPAEPTQSSTTGTDAPLVIQKLESAGVTTVIPLVPFNVFFPLLQAETQQKYFPKLLLSDYEESIESALGLIPIPYETALNGQEGVTTQTLGGVDDTRPESKGGYDPGLRDCYKPWHKAYPQPVGKPGTYTLKVTQPTGQVVTKKIVTKPSSYIEEQGPVQAWCTAIRLFATAARNAGPDLNRRTFVEGMAKVKNFPGGSSPVLTYGPHKFDGPTKYQIVQIHNNTPASSACDLLHTGNPQGTCWVTKQHWEPLPSG